MRVAAFLTGLGLICALPGAAWAHPDIALTARVLFNVNHGRLTAIAETWDFDAAFSARLLADYDHDGNGLIDPAESAAIATDFLPRLKANRFFSFLSLAGRDIGPLRPFGLTVSARDHIVSFAFGLVLPEPIAPGDGEISLEIRDKDLQMLATFAKDRPVLLRGLPDTACRTAITPDPQQAYFGKTVVPDRITLDCAR